MKASLSANCPGLRCQAVLCCPLPCHLPESSLVCGHSPHTTDSLRTSRYKIKHTPALTLQPIWASFTNRGVKKYDLFYGDRIKGVWPSQGLLTQRVRKRDGGLSEGEIKTERGEKERGGLGCRQRPVFRQWFKKQLLYKLCHEVTNIK